MSLDLSPPDYAHQQMGRVERMHGVRLATARTIGIFSKLGLSLWPYYVMQANMIHNKLPVLSHGGAVPEEILTKRNVDWTHVHIVGLRCAFWLDAAQRNESSKSLVNRALHGIYLGKCWDKSAHHVLVPSNSSPTNVAYVTTSSFVRPNYRLPPCGERNFSDDTWDVPSVADDSAPDGGVPVPSSGLSPTYFDSSSTFVDETVIDSNALHEEQESETLQPNSYALVPDDSDVGGQVGDGEMIPVPDTDTTTPVCETVGCRFPKDHPGPCQTYVPVQSGPLEGVPSSRVQSHPRERRQAPNPNDLPTFTGVWANTVAYLCMTMAVALPVFAFAAATGTTPMSIPDVMASAVPVPKGFKAAVDPNNPWHEYWLEAIYKEISGLLSLNVWTVIKKKLVPKGSNIMRCHFVFTLKQLATGMIERFKARLVADGNTQRFGLDYDRVFSTVVKWITLRLCLLLAAVYGWHISGVDISQAFLYGLLDEDIFMLMPEGLPQFDADGDALCVKLNRSLYGLKQAPRVWNEVLTTWLVSYGFKQSEYDPCLFIYSSSGIIMMVLIWVDDCIIMDNSSDARAKFVKSLATKFKITVKPDLDWVLGVHIVRDMKKQTISLSQELYITELYERFHGHLKGMSKSYSTPAGPEAMHFSRADCPAENSAEWVAMQPLKSVYMTLVGSFIWLFTASVPEIGFITSMLGRFTDNPAKVHLRAAYRALIYLHGRASLPLVLGGHSDLTFRVWVDASWMPDSITGCLYTVGHSVVDWFTRKQIGGVDTAGGVSRSSMAAESRATADAGAGGIFIRDLCIELSCLAEVGLIIKTTDLLCDSESTIKVLQDVFACKRSKSFITDVKSVRDWVLRLIYRFVKIKTALHHADVMTKPLAIGPFQFHRDAILNAHMSVPASENAQFTSFYVSSQIFCPAYNLPSYDFSLTNLFSSSSSSPSLVTDFSSSSSSTSLVASTSSSSSSSLVTTTFSSSSSPPLLADSSSSMSAPP